MTTWLSGTEASCLAYLLAAVNKGEHERLDLARVKRGLRTAGARRLAHTIYHKQTPRGEQVSMLSAVRVLVPREARFL